MSKERALTSGEQLDPAVLENLDSLSRALHLVDQGIFPAKEDLRSIRKEKGVDYKDGILRRLAGLEQIPLLTGWGRFRIGKWRPFAGKEPRIDREIKESINPQDQRVEFWQLHNLHRQRRETFEERVQTEDQSVNKKDRGLIATGISSLRHGLNVAAFQRRIEHGSISGDEFDALNLHHKFNRAKVRAEAAQLVSEVTGDKLEFNIQQPKFRDSKALRWFRSTVRTPYAPVPVPVELPINRKPSELTAYAPIPVPGDFQKQTEPVPEIPENESSLKAKARKALQKSFKIQIKTARQAKKQPELYEATRNETLKAIANMDSKIIYAAADGISDESLLTTTVTNRRLRNLFKFSKEDIANLGENDKQRLKAAKVILTSVARSKSAHKRAVEKKKILDNIDWGDSQVALEMENGIPEVGLVDDDSFESEYETTDPFEYIEAQGVTLDAGTDNRYNGRSGRTKGTPNRPTVQPPRNGTGRRVIHTEPSRPAIILNAGGLPSSNPLFQDSMATATTASVGVSVAVMERSELQEKAVVVEDTMLDSIEDYLRARRSNTDSSEAQVVSGETTYDEPLSLDSVLNELSHSGMAKFTVGVNGVLQAEIDYSDQRARGVLDRLDQVDLRNLDLSFESGNRLVVRDLVPA